MFVKYNAPIYPIKELYGFVAAHSCFGDLFQLSVNHYKAEGEGAEGAR